MEKFLLKKTLVRKPNKHIKTMHNTTNPQNEQHNHEMNKINKIEKLNKETHWVISTIDITHVWVKKIEINIKINLKWYNTKIKKLVKEWK